MRIVGGYLSGRRFNPPADKWPTRPTTDFAKESLYNILQNKIEFSTTKMLDLFGGTGSHCYEFISRGCVDATYVDKFRGCVAFVKKTAADLDIEDKVQIHCMDVFRFIGSTTEKYDYIFAGPPYPLHNLNSIPDKIFDHGILNKDGLLVVEHDSANNFEQHPCFLESRTYGSAVFAFLKQGE